jgi:porin
MRKIRKMRRAGWSALVAVILGALAATPLRAEEEASPALAVEALYRVDLIGPVQGGVSRRGSVLDNLDLVADLDLGRAIGWSGATIHGYILSNNGQIPNDRAGTLQGVDNIEVARQGVRLYELWLQAPVGDDTTVLVGLYDLNSEFYANDAADLLIAPPFGIGSELAATGPNGPSIFPSTAIALRVNHDFPTGYVRAAVLNARAGVPGDPDGTDLSFGDGALMIAEAGTHGSTRFAVGLWRYSDRQDDIWAVNLAGQPLKRVAAGGYALAEATLFGDEAGDGPWTRGFVRIGVSDGDTSPFRGGWQAGVVIDRLLPGRPDSQASIGVQQGVLSSNMRAILASGGADAARAESGFEVTYSDRLTPRIRIQPDLQVIFDAGGDRRADPVVIIGARLTIDLIP